MSLDNRPSVNKDVCLRCLRWAAPLSATKNIPFSWAHPKSLSLIKAGPGSVWKAAPGVSLRLFLLNTFITSSLWQHLYVGTTARQHSSKTGDSNDLLFLITDFWTGTLGEQHGCFSTIMVPMVKKQSKTTGRPFLLQVLSNQKEKGWEFRATFLLWSCFPFMERSITSALTQHCCAPASHTHNCPKELGF